MASSEDDKRMAAYLGSNVSNEATKAANIDDPSHEILDDLGGRVVPQKVADKVKKKAEPDLWLPSHKAFLDQTIVLNEHSGPADTYLFINEQLKSIADDFQNFKTYDEEFKTVGYHLENERAGCYSIELFNAKEAESIGINFSRYQGNAKALSSLWKEIKKRFSESNYYIDKFMDNLGDNEHEVPEVDEEQMEALKYITFSKDGTLVNLLIDDIKSGRKGVTATALLLLQHNLNKEENMEVI